MLEFDFESFDINAVIDSFNNNMAISEYSSYSVNELMEIEKDVEHFDKLIEEQKHRRAKPLKEEITSINLGTNSNPQEVKIGSTLSPQERDEMMKLLREFKDVFAWSYEDMPGLDPEIAVHKIPLKPDAKPVKQKLRRVRPEQALMIKEEIVKQLKAGFIVAVHYPKWVANRIE